MDRFNLKMIKNTLGVEIESNCNRSYCYSIVLISINSPYCLGLWCCVMIWVIDLELRQLAPAQDFGILFLCPLEYTI